MPPTTLPPLGLEGGGPDTLPPPPCVPVKPWKGGGGRSGSNTFFFYRKKHPRAIEGAEVDVDERNFREAKARAVAPSRCRG